MLLNFWFQTAFCIFYVEVTKNCSSRFTWRTCISATSSSKLWCCQENKDVTELPTATQSPGHRCNCSYWVPNYRTVTQPHRLLPASSEQGDRSHPFKEATVFSLNIKASIYIKNSCKRQERQESDFRPNKCIAGNKWSTGNLKAIQQTVSLWSVSS